MALDTSAIRERLRVLGNRDWPSVWDARAANDNGDFLGWSHRYRLYDPATEAEIATFETAHGISLPSEYRRFLKELGNGGAGPGYGIFPLGEGEEEPLADEVLQNLAQPFPHDASWNDTSLIEDDGFGGFVPSEAYYARSVMAGAMEIATEGCALFYLLVVSGPRAGEIWFDRRADGKGLAPLTDEQGTALTFDAWYMRWLDNSWSSFGPA